MAQLVNKANRMDFAKVLLEKLDIVKLIEGWGVKLTEKGSNKYWALCPFHRESRPSFCVNASEHYFYCFGCKKGGNIFKFLRLKKNITFIEALEEIAEKVENIHQFNSASEKNDVTGMLRTLLSRLDQHTTQKATNHILYDLFEKVCSFYQHNLQTSSAAAKKATIYLFRRGIKPDLIQKFKIGLASYEKKKNILLDYLKAEGYDETVISLSNLISKSGSAAGKGFFQDVIVFPIFDRRGRCISFIGRKYSEENINNFSKYLLLPNSFIFEKRAALYGVQEAQRFSFDSSLYLVEGVIDMIILYRRSVKKVVGLLGSRLTKEQVVTIKEITSRVTIFFDGDQVGIEQALSSSLLLLNENLGVEVVCVPKNLDPAELLSGQSDDYFDIENSKIEATQFAIDYYYSLFKEKRDLTSLEDFLAEIFPFLLSYNSPARREFYLKKIAKIVDIPIDSLRAELWNLGLEKKVPSLKISDYDQVFLREQMIICLSLFDYESFLLIRKSISKWVDSVNEGHFRRLSELYREGKLIESRNKLYFQFFGKNFRNEEKISEFIKRLFLIQKEEEGKRRRFFKDITFKCLRDLDRKVVDKKIAILRRKLSSSTLDERLREKIVLKIWEMRDKYRESVEKG